MSSNCSIDPIPIYNSDNLSERDLLLLFNTRTWAATDGLVWVKGVKRSMEFVSS
jgi:hypothetical protein